MNAAAKFILRDSLKEKMPELTDDVVYKIISELDKLGVLKDSSETGSSRSIDSEKRVAKGLPESFNMISPLWKGEVTLVKREGFFAYQDSDNNIRLHARTEKDLNKKVLKYNK